MQKKILLDNNSALIKSVIRRFYNKGVEYDDLYQIACIGFLKAVKNFDESFGVKFSTYTVPMIIGEIKRYMRDNGAIKVSRTLKILSFKLSLPPLFQRRRTTIFLFSASFAYSKQSFK